MSDKKLWCADATDSDDLPSKLGMIEIAGDSAKGVNIQPGYSGNSAYDADRDGQIFVVPSSNENDDAGVACGVFWNWAMRAGWQRWRPNYRYAEIGDIDYDADTCDLTLDDIFATEDLEGVQRSINPDDNVLTAVPIEYMECNSAAFEIGDRVIVKFENYSWLSPKVIGFESNPKQCTWHIVIRYGDYCTIWDIRQDKVAENIPLDSDPESSASFPCLYSDINAWVESKTAVSANDLFSAETDNGNMPSYSTEEVGEGSFNTYELCPPIDGGASGGCSGFESIVVGNGSDENIFGWDNQKTYSHETGWAECTACPSDDHSGDYFSGYIGKTDRDEDLTYGIVLTPQNCDGTKIGFWMRKKYTEITSYVMNSMFGDPSEGYVRSEEYSWNISRGNGYGGEYNQDHYFESEPGGVFTRQSSVVYPPTSWWATPWTETGDPDLDKDAWNIIYAAHFIVDEDLITQFFIKRVDADNVEAFAAIGDDTDVDPYTMDQHATATTALQALVNICSSDEFTAVYVK